MNLDDFEKKLERQTLRQPPEAWRKEVLNAARVSIRTHTPPSQPGWLDALRALLARIPVAWSAVVGIWLVILGVNSVLLGSSAPTVAKTSAPAPRDAWTVWNLRQTEMSLLANGPIDFPELAPPRPNPVAPPRPRSDRRDGDGLGELNREDALAGLV